MEIDRGGDHGFASTEIVELASSSADHGLRRRKRSKSSSYRVNLHYGYPGSKGHSGNLGLQDLVLLVPKVANRANASDVANRIHSLRPSQPGWFFADSFIVC